MLELIGLDLAQLYGRYRSELVRLTTALRPAYHAMARAGMHTGISDVEGELIYLLLRETKPQLAFEISPAAGWSTNYILAALTANQQGVCHSFEIQARTRRKPAEQVIRSNQTALCDQRRLVVHIGDARHEAPKVSGAINFLFIDSCHENWFAKWYAETLFPRVDGIVMLEDIAYADQIERSTEAAFVWKWLHERCVSAQLAGALALEPEVGRARAGLRERTAMRGNAVLFRLPLGAAGPAPEITPSPVALIEQTEETVRHGRAVEADALLSQAIPAIMADWQREDRHRFLLRGGACYVRMGERAEARRCFQRALGVVVASETNVRRPKGYAELLAFFLAQHQWSFIAKTFAVMSLDGQLLTALRVFAQPCTRRMAGLARRVRPWRRG